MPSMSEMVEAHLINVQREIANLQEKAVVLNKEVEKLKEYLAEGSEVLKTYKVNIEKPSVVQEQVESTNKYGF